MSAVKTFWVVATLGLTAAAIVSAQDHPKVETFLGFTYTRANSATNVPAFSANGGGGQFAVNANKWVGFVADVGAVHNGNIGGYHLDTTLTNFLFGPRISIRKSRVIPYFNVLFGGVYAGTSMGIVATPVATPATVNGLTPTPGQPVTLRASASQTSFAMTTGGGIDIKINRHVTFRPIGLDYYMTRLQNLRSANDNNQHNLRYTTGLNFTFGGEAPAPPPPPPPPPPAMKACKDGSSVLASAPCPKMNMNVAWTSAQASLCEGGVIKLAPEGIPEGAAFQWTVQGQPISQGPTLEFGTTGREPGTYKVGLTVSAPDYADVAKDANITIRGYRPPAVTLDISPREIKAGDKATVTVNVTPGECGGNAGAPVLSASEGSITGNVFDSSEIRFDPAASAEQRKSVTITAKVSDDKSGGSAMAAVVVTKQAVARRLPDIIFPAANARVNNCGKRVLLEDLKAAIESDPGGKVVLVGHTSAKEHKAGLDQARALDAAAVLSAGEGVCYNFSASRILVAAVGTEDNGADYQAHFCGSTQERPGSLVKESDSDARERRVEVWFIASGAALPASLKDYKDAASLNVASLGCPK